VAAGGLALVGVIGLLDYATGPELSLAIFYLAPVALCAWWGGFAHGVLVAVAATAAWHQIDLLEGPAPAHVVQWWNAVVRFGAFVFVASLLDRLRAGLRREWLLARTDPLTGAANARTFYEAVHAESGRAQRTGRPLTLAYVDLDDFKQLNDRLGHSAGDRALLCLVQTARSALRASDVFARLGGDEFALLLPETEAPGALLLLQRLHALLGAEMARRGWAVTTSMGAVTFLRPAGDVDVMIGHIDALMYAAKKAGKGQVRHEVNGPGPALPAVATEWPERRATARVLCDHPVQVRADVDAGEPGLAIVRNLSTAGVGLHMERRLLEGALLIIEPLHPGGAKTLLARVVRLAEEPGGWLHGCVLCGRLSEEELGGWVHPRPGPAD
jgi:diguanylate cyclase (GGDEF)-like protein